MHYVGATSSSWQIQPPVGMPKSVGAGQHAAALMQHAANDRLLPGNHASASHPSLQLTGTSHYTSRCSTPLLQTNYKPAHTFPELQVPMHAAAQPGTQLVMCSHGGSGRPAGQLPSIAPAAGSATELSGDRPGKPSSKASSKGKGKGSAARGAREEGPEQWDPRRPDAQKTVFLSEWLNRETQVCLPRTKHNTAKFCSA